GARPSPVPASNPASIPASTLASTPESVPASIPESTPESSPPSSPPPPPPQPPHEAPPTTSRKTMGTKARVIAGIGRPSIEDDSGYLPQRVAPRVEALDARGCRLPNRVQQFRSCAPSRALACSGV